jgi:hypothetical protein
MGDENKKSFWTSLPGILTGVAAVIVAVGGILAAYNHVHLHHYPHRLQIYLHHHLKLYAGHNYQGLRYLGLGDGQELLTVAQSQVFLHSKTIVCMRMFQSQESRLMTKDLFLLAAPLLVVIRSLLQTKLREKHILMTLVVSPKILFMPLMMIIPLTLTLLEHHNHVSLERR